MVVEDSISPTEVDRRVKGNVEDEAEKNKHPAQITTKRLRSLSREKLAGAPDTVSATNEYGDSEPLAVKGSSAAGL